MYISFVEFLEQIISNTPLLIITVLTLGVILVNGWTDAPNAIATCVSTRSLSPKKAIIMEEDENGFNTEKPFIADCRFARSTRRCI